MALRSLFGRLGFIEAEVDPVVASEARPRAKRLGEAAQMVGHSSRLEALIRPPIDSYG